MKKKVRPDYDPIDDEKLEDLLLQLAKRIKSLRRKKGYTSAETFSYDHFFTRSQYGKYEKMQNIEMTTFFKLCHAFNVTPIQFFNEGFDWDSFLSDESGKK